MSESVQQPKNITISAKGNEICDLLEESGFFENGLHAYRVAIFVALAANLPDTLDDDPTMKTLQNKWDTDAVFRSKGNNVEAALLALGVDPDETIIKGKRLGELGLRYLGSKIERHADILDIIVPTFSLEA